MRLRKKSIINIIANIFVVLVKLMILLIKGCVWIFSVCLPAIVYFIWSSWGYSKSEYKKITNNSFLNMCFDKGKRGEYLLYRHLKDKNEDAKWLFNLYLPKEDGRTTEIDVLMLHPSGIYVFEVKNYSGWIFGASNRGEWTQCIKPSETAKTQKFHFLNPLIQNNIHVKYLKNYLDVEVQNCICPIVAFGNRCKLKHISLNYDAPKVILLKEARNALAGRLSNKVIDKTMINKIYVDLFRFTQVNDGVKAKHIRDINESYSDLK